MWYNKAINKLNPRCLNSRVRGQQRLLAIMYDYTPVDIARFWTKVAITANPEKCWEWQASCYRDGYGQVAFYKRHPKNMAAHRVAWELTHSYIPDGLWVLHKCDNRKCVNPNHLFLGTREDNEQDKMQKGRQPSGERVGLHKLTYEMVKQIRITYAAKLANQYELASRYGVNQSIISLVVNNKLWKVIPE